MNPFEVRPILVTHTECATIVQDAPTPQKERKMKVSGIVTRNTEVTRRDTFYFEGVEVSSREKAREDVENYFRDDPYMDPDDTEEIDWNYEDPEVEELNYEAAEYQATVTVDFTFEGDRDGAEDWICKALRRIEGYTDGDGNEVNLITVNQGNEA